MAMVSVTLLPLIPPPDLRGVDEMEGDPGVSDRRKPGTPERERMVVPQRPTKADRRKPAFDRSRRYQSTGLTSARVRETWSVDCQGSLRFGEVSHRRCLLVKRGFLNLQSQRRCRQRHPHFGRPGSSLLGVESSRRY